MKKFLIILLAFSFTQELEVDGDLKVTGNIQSEVIDSLYAEINELKSILSNQNIGFKNIEHFESGSHEWVVPENINLALVQVWGAGGGSGGRIQHCGTGSGYGSSGVGGGGGAGGYAESYLVVTSGDIINLQVGGGGGSGGSDCNYYLTPFNITQGGNGGDSYFGDLIYATGGIGGCANGNANLPCSSGSSPGTGITGQLLIAGQSGTNIGATSFMSDYAWSTGGNGDNQGGKSGKIIIRY